MAEGFHPPPSSSSPSQSLKPKAGPPSGTYLIQLPKDLIYRIPPPENTSLFEFYSRRASSPSRRRRRCLLTALILLLLLASLLTAAGGLLFLLLRPRLPSFSLDRLSFSPQIAATFRVANPNDRIAVRYVAGGEIALSYAGVGGLNGVAPWPEFSQGAGNVTVVEAGSMGQGIRAADPGEAAVLLEVAAPARFRAEGVSSWKVTIRVRCDVVVDGLAAEARIVGQQCGARMDFWR